MLQVLYDILFRISEAGKRFVTRSLKCYIPSLKCSEIENAPLYCCQRTESSWRMANIEFLPSSLLKCVMNIRVCMLLVLIYLFITSLFIIRFVYWVELMWVLWCQGYTSSDGSYSAVHSEWTTGQLLSSLLLFHIHHFTVLVRIL